MGLFFKILINLFCSIIPLQHISAKFDQAVEACLEADIEKASLYFNNEILKGNKSHAGALHSLSNIAVIKGNFEQAYEYHEKAIISAPGSLPPLAVLYQKGENFSGIGEIFWVSSFAKKNLYDAKTKMQEDPAGNSKAYEEVAFNEHISLAMLVERYGFAEYAREHYFQAEKLHPDDPTPRVRRALSVPVIYDSSDHLIQTRRQLEHDVQHLLEDAKSGNLTLAALNQFSMPGTFYLVYQGFNDAALMTQIQEAYVSMYPALEEVSVHTNPWDGRRKIRVGFVSAYFREHSVCKVLCGIIHNLDREKFEVVVFSSTSQEDSWTEYVKQDTEFVNTRTALISNRYLVTRRKLDILVYADVGMDTPTTVWAFARLAPVQICFWGHPVTTGLAHMDYYLSSDWFEPDTNAQERFSEQLIRMDTLSYYFKKPTQKLQTDKVQKDFLKIDFGIPQCERIFLCPQSLMKFHPDFDAAINGILSADLSACLILLYDEAKGAWKQRLQKRLEKTVSHSSRILFLKKMPHRNFLQLLAASDLLLDPFPFGGGITSMEAFSICKGSLTAPSRLSIPSFTGGMLRRSGIHELIAEEEENGVSNTTTSTYIRLAIEFGSNQSVKNKIQAKVCSKETVSLLYENMQAVKEWESVLHNLVYK